METPRENLVPAGLAVTQAPASLLGRSVFLQVSKAGLITHSQVGCMCLLFSDVGLKWEWRRRLEPFHVLFAWVLSKRTFGMCSSSETAWDRESTAGMVGGREAARLRQPHLCQPIGLSETRAGTGCPHSGDRLGCKLAWKICCLELDNLDHILLREQYCVWPFWPQPRP